MDHWVNIIKENIQVLMMKTYILKYLKSEKVFKGLDAALYLQKMMS